MFFSLSFEDAHHTFAFLSLLVLGCNRENLCTVKDSISDPDSVMTPKPSWWNLFLVQFGFNGIQHFNRIHSKCR